MQHSLIEIRDKLLEALDEDHNVSDMVAVREVITVLETFPITKDALEETELARVVNKMRKKIPDKTWSKRAKGLLRKWGNMILPQSGREVNGGVAHTRTSGGVGTKQLNARISPGIRVTSPPGSAPSSASTSPILPHSRPVTPSSNLAGRALSPGRPPGVGFKSLSPGFSKSHLKPQSPSVAMSRPVTPKVSGTLPNSSPRKQTSNPVSPVGTHSQSSRTDSILQAGSSNAVAKTNVANKRLRKEDEDSQSDFPIRKKTRNSYLPNGLESASYDEESRDSFSGDVSDLSKVPGAEGKQRRNRDKNDVDVLKKNFSHYNQLGKSKTTQQLIAELARKSSSPSFPSAAEMTNRSTSSRSKLMKQLAGSSLDDRHSDIPDGASNKFLMDRFLQSQPDVSVPSLSEERSALESPPASQSSAPKTDEVEKRESLEEILLKLPPVDPDEIDWESDEYEVNFCDKIVTDEEISKLHEEHIECMNGNEGHDGEFKEWHETVSKVSYKEDLLHILPYVITE